MSISSQASDDEEIHDLVLMFANSRIPRGSDAFQSILDDLLPLKEETENDQTDGALETDVFDSGPNKEEGKSDTAVRAESNTPEQQHVRFSDPNVKTSAGKSRDKRLTRLVSPKPNTHVHWPNAERDIASSPTTDKLHHARIYMKTVPAKPILKHDDDYKDHMTIHVNQT